MGALLAVGKVPGYSVIHKYGRLPATANETWEDVWAEGGTYTWQAAAVTLGVSSDSTADTSTGTGARTVEIQGLDAAYAVQTETLTLNGQTKVESANAYLRVFRAKMLTVGTGGVNAGKVYVYDTADTPVGGVPPTATRIMGTVVAGYGQTQMGLYTIPAGYSGFLLARYVGFSIRANQYVDVEFWSRPFGGSWLQKSLDPVSGGQGPPYRPYVVPMEDDLSEKADLRFRAKASAASIDVVVEFDLMLVVNGLLD
jgi:hypothetical protein